MRIYRRNEQRLSVTEFFAALREDCAREAKAAGADKTSGEFDAIRDELFEAKKELVRRGKIVRFENTSGNEYQSRRVYYTPMN